MKILLAVASLALALSTSAFAGNTYPSLVGTWDVKSEGALMLHGKGGTGQFTHWNKGQKTLTAVLEITSQDGRVLRGVFKSQRGTEPFVAVIGNDKKIYLADEDGMLDARIVNKNTIEAVYRHVSAKDTVVAAATWTRRK